MIKVHLDKAKGVLDISNELFAYRFTRAAAGFPGRIGFQGESHPLADRQEPWLSATLGGNRRIYPVLLKDFKPVLWPGGLAVCQPGGGMAKAAG